MNGNPFYVQPGGDYGSALSGIGNTLSQVAESQRKQKRFEDAKAAMTNAWSSGDADEMMQVAIDYPEVSQTVKDMFGLKNAQTEKASTDMYRRIIADPQNAEKYFERGINDISDMGGKPENAIADLGMYRRDPKAAVRKITMAYAAADPRGYKALSDANKEAQSDDSSAVKDLKFWKALKGKDAELWEAFGKERGYINEEGEELSVHLQKRLSEATDNARKAAGNSRSFSQLASDFEKSDYTPGIFGSWQETAKEITGNTDYASELKKRFNSVRASEAIANLPPGAASDFDVALALSGFPDEKANKETIASFLRGLSKLEEANAAYETFKSNYISGNGHERGLLEAWEKEQGQGESEEGQPAPEEAQQEEVVVYENHPTKGLITESDISYTMEKYGMTREEVMQKLEGTQQGPTRRTRSRR